MAALYLTAEQPNKSLVWLKKAEAFLGAMQELPSIILQRTLLLRHLAECYLQLNDLNNASVVSSPLFVFSEFEVLIFICIHSAHAKLCRWADSDFG